MRNTQRSTLKVTDAHGGASLYETLCGVEIRHGIARGFRRHKDLSWEAGFAEQSSVPVYKQTNTYLLDGRTQSPTPTVMCPEVELSLSTEKRSMSATEVSHRCPRRWPTDEVEELPNRGGVLELYGRESATPTVVTDVSQPV
jgi:hypothetical protein